MVFDFECHNFVAAPVEKPRGLGAFFSSSACNIVVERRHASSRILVEFLLAQDAAAPFRNPGRRRVREYGRCKLSGIRKHLAPRFRPDIRNGLFRKKILGSSYSGPIAVVRLPLLLTEVGNHLIGEFALNPGNFLPDYFKSLLGFLPQTDHDLRIFLELLLNDGDETSA